ncbi:hypothetical protein VCV18_005490 [Metarhizium anisopliae]
MRVLPKASLARKAQRSTRTRRSAHSHSFPPKLKGKKPTLSVVLAVSSLRPSANQQPGGGGKTHDTGGTTPALRQ